MSKAEEFAYSKYPKSKKGVLYDLARNSIIQGYHQAEKDMELSWEDISRIINIDQQVCGTMGISDYIHNHQQAMEEVLKRFKDLKNDTTKR